MFGNQDGISADSARGPQGEWRVERRLVVGAAVLLGVTVLAVFPFRLLPSPWWADSVLHLVSGTALTLLLIGAIPRRDDAIAGAVVVGGVLFEPVEWTYFVCELQLPVIAPEECRAVTLTEWLMRDDTLKDAALVTVGTLVTLVLVGRYQ
ncbi:MAG: hypothetical protein A07HB70_01551 [uncultured archaeon A07HB70]|nr:MAG: hypothetical protein A07HB70_01551 [uncultured archaeon A07HB70]